ncbi:VOC family protein [Pseudoteredinibacter isoporae]|uniref:VOC domain-containing protein n=1 Tax=Pseudoteredinibacter isoporae TaxID=570281 RepID=A0A7X0JQF7_9GAMM|nr:VOC family protein [Pseudoteredinibacter isoporae]MBB6520407.1 hypothetical protein [Pseudoteredinibacter isoporae]NHO85975.1 VOC family protein [Pseudoteredinibacter isoporae]NIB25573.1 VOC family protein [Pseudoteredinibacter isoporae]
MKKHQQINYIEMPSQDLEKTKAFFNSAFGWTFQDYGPDYCDFHQDGIDGGFYRIDLAMNQEAGSALIVLYSDNLEASEKAVVDAGGEISKPCFDFPGGRRFHFREPCGNEFAIWSES